ncbi:MAG: sensor histidine kinase [Christensenellales bacterium]
MGLAMARQIARLHGGELTVVSEEGKGSAFTARFPMQ